MRILSLFSALLFSICCQGQIKVAERSRPVLHNTVNTQYDSTVDDVLKDYELLLGQDIFITDPPTMFPNSFTGFYTEKSCTSASEYHVENVDDRQRIPMQYLKGRTFTVTNIFPSDVVVVYPQKILELKDKNNGEVLYFTYQLSGNYYDAPFVIVGYYEKLKKDMVGKVLVSNGAMKRATDTETKLLVENPKGKQWKCVDVVCTDDPFGYRIILKNKDETIMHSVSRYHENTIYKYYEPLNEVHIATNEFLRNEFQKWDDQTKKAGIGILDVEPTVTEKTAGIDLKLVNRKTKDIKYIYVTLVARNRVNDVLVRKELQGTGPVAPGDLEQFRFTKALPVKEADKVDIEAIKVQFFDGTFLTVKGPAAIANIHFPYNLDDVPSARMLID